MDAFTCDIHNREACVVDLDLSLFICQKCALFDPTYKHHEFIDRESLPAHALKLYQQFQEQIGSLNLTVDAQTSPEWKTLDKLARQALDTRAKDINSMYDQMITEIELERTHKLTMLAEQITSIVRNSSEEVNLIVRQKYQQLLKTSHNYELSLQKSHFMQICKELSDKSSRDVIASIEKDLSIIELDLKYKLGFIGVTAVPDLGFARKRTSTKDELLIPNESTKQLSDFKESTFCKTERISMRAIFKTEASPVPQTERCSTINSRELDSSWSQIEIDPKTTKKITGKSELKNLMLKNTVNRVILAGLNLNNREALEALRRCTTGTFVGTVDLSNNQLTSQFVVQLKRQKNHSKYLKKILLKGINLSNNSSWAKEGLSLDLLKQGRLKIGQISLQN